MISIRALLYSHIPSPKYS